MVIRVITRGGVYPNDGGKSRIDGSNLVLDIGHGGSTGQTTSAVHSFSEPSMMLAFASFHEFIWGMSAKSTPNDQSVCGDIPSQLCVPFLKILPYAARDTRLMAIQAGGSRQ